jgi:hypothetical protein
MTASAAATIAPAAVGFAATVHAALIAAGFSAGSHTRITPVGAVRWVWPAASAESGPVRCRIAVIEVAGEIEVRGEDCDFMSQDWDHPEVIVVWLAE